MSKVMKILTIFIALVLTVSAQTWVSRARLKGFNEYFLSTIQELAYELEKKGWSNFKLDNLTTVINEHMYDWHVAGNVTYANGFIISIQRIDVSGVESFFSSRTMDTRVDAFSTVRGIMNFRDVNIGFDVLFEELDGTSHRHTSVFTYSLIDFPGLIVKNYTSQEITTTVTSNNFRAGSVRITYLPANNITEVLSRRFLAANFFSNAIRWGNEILKPILHKLVTTKIEYPEVCFINC